MAEFNVAETFKLYVPALLEEQTERFSQKDGEHVFNYRLKAGTSEIEMRGLATYVMEGTVPFMEMDLETGVETLSNLLPAKFPRWGLGGVVPHPRRDWDYDYWSFNTDFIVEKSLQGFPIIPGFMLQGPTQTNRVDAEIDGYSGYWLEYKTGTIMAYSPALEAALQRYFRENKELFPHKDWKLNFSSDLFKIHHLFGSTKDVDGIIGRRVGRSRGFRSSPSTITINSLWSTNSLTGMTDEEKGRVTGRYVLESNDESILATKVYFTPYEIPLELMTEGGGTQTTTNGQRFPAGLQIHFDLGNQRVYGRGDAGRVLIITVQPEGRTVTTQIGLNGDFVANLPLGSNFTTWQDFNRVSARYQEDGESNASTTTTQIDPTLVKALGKPLLKTKKGFLVSTPGRPTLSGRLTTGNQATDWTASFRQETQGEQGLRYGGLSIEPGPFPQGRKNLGYEPNKLFYPSLPGAIIKHPAATLNLIARAYGPGNNGERVGVSDADIAHIILEKVPLQTKSTELRTSWRNSQLVTKRLTYKIKYRRSWEARSLKLTIRYRTNVKRVTKSLRMRMKWVNRSFRTRKLEYTIRWRSNQPGLVTKRAFYVFRWEQKTLFTKSLRMSIRWRFTKTKTKSIQLRTQWRSRSLEPVMLKPFFIMTKPDPNKDEWVKKISFQVYGNPDIVQSHIISDSLQFYFTNPDKFEIIRFDYNALPYQGIVVDDIKDEVLNARGDIPLTYELVGNYTITGVNPKNSFSLDVVGGTTQLNEARSYWVPMDVAEGSLGRMVRFKDGSESYAYELDGTFRDDHHEDVVELDLIMLNQEECCFTSKSSGSRCSPF